MADTMSVDEAIALLQRVVDRPDDLENNIIDMREFERAWAIVKDAVNTVALVLEPILDQVRDTSWLVDTIAEVLANGGNVNDERGAARDIAETLIQARMRVFVALGLTQRHLIKGSAITEERTVWVDQ